jgi:hypothetical protein
MNWLKKMIIDSVVTALTKSRFDVTCDRDPTNNDDFDVSCTWTNRNTGKKWRSICRKTIWVEDVIDTKTENDMMEASKRKLPPGYFKIPN